MGGDAQIGRRSLLGGMLLGLVGVAPRADAAEPVKIAFVDTGNTGRSLMAEHLARRFAQRAGWSMSVISRGLDVDPFDAAPEANARCLLGSRGIDVAGHEARPLGQQDVAHADLLLTMTKTHREAVESAWPVARGRVFLLADYAIGKAVDVPDAWGKPMSAYRAVLAQLDAWLPLALARAQREHQGRLQS